MNARRRFLTRLAVAPLALSASAVLAARLK